MNKPFANEIKRQESRFTISARKITAPPGSLTGLMVEPQRLDWFKVRLTYRDVTGAVRSLEMRHYQSKVRKGLTPTLYAVLVVLMEDLLAFMVYENATEFQRAVPCCNKPQAEAIFEVTRERGLAFANLLGSDLQPFMEAYTERPTPISDYYGAIVWERV